MTWIQIDSCLVNVEKLWLFEPPSLQVDTSSLLDLWPTPEPVKVTRLLVNLQSRSKKRMPCSDAMNIFSSVDKWKTQAFNSRHKTCLVESDLSIWHKRLLSVFCTHTPPTHIHTQTHWAILSHIRHKSIWVGTPTVSSITCGPSLGLPESKARAALGRVSLPCSDLRAHVTQSCWWSLVGP